MPKHKRSYLHAIYIAYTCIFHIAASVFGSFGMFDLSFVDLCFWWFGLVCLKPVIIAKI